MMLGEETQISSSSGFSRLCQALLGLYHFHNIISTKASEEEEYLHTHICNNIIHNSQKVKATEVSLDKWIRKM